MPLIFAGLLRLPFGTLLHHNNVFIGLSPKMNVVSLSRMSLSVGDVHSMAQLNTFVLDWWTVR